MSAEADEAKDVVDMDAVIQRVALKHGHGLLVSDPVMMLVTIMNCIAEAYDKHNNALPEKFAAILTQYRESTQAAAAQWRNDAREYANTVLNAAMTAARDNAAAVMAEGAVKINAIITDSLARQMAECLAAQREEFRLLKKCLAWMTGAVGVALAVAVLLALLGK